MPRFVSHVEVAHMPKVPRGRSIRVVFDLDVDAIRDYVMFDSKDRAEPWPVGVIAELYAVLSREFADINATAQTLTERT